MTRTKEKSFFSAKNNIDWQPVVKLHTGYSTDEVRASFHPNSNKKRTNLLLIIGGDVTKELGWTAKDRVVFYHNPMNPYHLKIVKSDTNGYSLSASGRFNVTCGFAWGLTKEEPVNGIKTYFEIMPNNTLEVKIK